MFKKCGVCVMSLLFFCMTLLVACDSGSHKNSEESVENKASLATTSSRAQENVEQTEVQDQSGDAAITNVPQVVSYLCESGMALEAIYSDEGNTALIRYQDEEYELTHAVSASGARYTGEGMEWWTKGTSATLSKLNDNQETSEVMESCTQEETFEGETEE